MREARRVLPALRRARPGAVVRPRRSVVVVGGGAAGLAAARTAAREGARTVLVADGPLGGDCTWTGCVPSKSLLERGAAGDGWAAARTHLLAARDHIAGTEDEEALAADGVTVVRGRAHVEPGPCVRVVHATTAATHRLPADGVVWAAGSVPERPDLPGLPDVDALTNETVFDLPAAPGSLVVLGGGAIGCELATAFARFGTRVTLVEPAPRLLTKEEPEASRVVAGSLRALGVTVRTGSTPVRVEAVDGGVRVVLADGGVVAERLLLATGRRPVVGEDPPYRTGARGQVVVDERMRTSLAGVWSAGDCTGRLPFTHAADAMGRVAGRNAARGWTRGRARYDDRATPWVTFTDPEVARVGLSEAEAAEQVPGARVVHLPLAEVDRALASGRTEGFVTLVVGPRRLTRDLGGGRLLGATVVAPAAGETIAELALAMHLDVLTGRLAQATHAYPTYGTAVQMAAAQLFGGFAGRWPRPARGEGPGTPA